MTVERPWLLPFSPAYGIAAGVKNLAHDRRWLSPRRLRARVISVGSLSAGGAGKTPVVMMLAAMCEGMGATVDVLSRGYGRNSGAIERVPPDGSAQAARRFGDEPVEMTRAGLHVFVGGDRLSAGRLAEQTLGSDVHLLDDGFQHRRLHRDLDIALLTEADAKDRLLPAGNLREGLSSLRRAQVVVLRAEEAGALQGVVCARSDAEVWIVRRELLLGVHLAKPYVFCGIARPEGFLAMIRKAGNKPVGSTLFKDHHAYTQKDVASLVRSARAAGADGFYLTAKDAVKLTVGSVQHMETVGPVHAPRLSVSLLDPGPARATLARALRRE